MGTVLLWDRLPETFDVPVWYPIAACTIGGVIIGLFRKRFGDYPQTMKTVVGTVKQTGSYPYNRIVVILIAAMLPLIFGSSVGPEAGMVGVLVALGCWANENLKFAKKNADFYSSVGMAVSLSILFYSPLFGFFSAVEREDDSPADGSRFSSSKADGNTLSNDNDNLDRSSKLLVYGISIASALSVLFLLNHLFGKVSEGFPSFGNAHPDKWDFLMMIVYIICGILLGLFFEKSEELLAKLSGKLPPVLGEVLAGLILGGAVSFLPVLQFSGESQMSVLITDYARYAPMAMIGIAILKVLLTNLCIQMGLKGGHFFPLIFAAVCLGYGISLLVFPMDAEHAVFAAAITTAATMSVSIRKPLAVTCLLFLCFPVKMGLWIFLAAILAGQVTRSKKHEAKTQ
ncbi:MAG: chloride channel protein [Bacillota bacterium]|nr:chloride channel protein [Bacillota bacterium]